MSMSEDQFDKIISHLNNNDGILIIHSKKLTENVSFANVWKEKPHEKTKRFSDDLFDSFYLIKKSEGEYIGLVYLMKNDLHWYLKEEHRGKGYMYKCLNNVIIPNILTFRPRIEITIDFANCEFADKSEKLALKCGFRKHKDGYYYFSKRFSKAVVNQSSSNMLLLDQRLEELVKETTELINRFKFIKSELDMKKIDSTLHRKLDKVIKSIEVFRGSL